MIASIEHKFGGDWTNLKLEVIGKYLSAYTVALKDKPSAARPFTKLYIDAFAGSGYINLPDEDSEVGELLFPELAEATATALLDGSARVALKAKPAFEKYIFVEKSQTRCGELEKLKDEFPDLKERIFVRQGEANTEIQALCMNQETFWKGHRAVLFLDPYGMQVDWATIEAIAKTRAIDLWLLFPVGIGANRLLTKTGRIPGKWKEKLDTFFGTSDWFDSAYRETGQPDLFENGRKVLEKVPVEVLGEYCNKRLKTIFAGVSEKPAVLMNSKGCPMYLLCFAASNAKGAKIAIKIADDILMKVS